MKHDVYLLIPSGVTFAQDIQIVSDDGDPVNLTDKSVSASLMKAFSSMRRWGFDVVVRDEANGEVTLRMPRSTTSEIPAGMYKFSVIVSWTDEEQLEEFAEQVCTGLIQVTDRIEVQP